MPDSGSTTVWDRVSNWAAEHKAVVYTVAGVTLVVTAGGLVYYLNQNDTRGSAPSPGSSTTSSSKKKNKKKKAKKEAEKETQPILEETKPGMPSGKIRKIGADNSAETKQPSVAATAEDELPDVSEQTVGTLSPEVCVTVEYLIL